MSDHEPDKLLATLVDKDGTPALTLSTGSDPGYILLEGEWDEANWRQYVIVLDRFQAVQLMCCLHLWLKDTKDVI